MSKPRNLNIAVVPEPSKEAVALAPSCEAAPAKLLAGQSPCDLNDRGDGLLGRAGKGAVGHTKTESQDAITRLPKDSDFLIGERAASWWTSERSLESTSPGMRSGTVLGSLAMPNLASCSRAEVLDYFTNGWMLTELLFSSLQGNEAFTRAPTHRLRHPLIFYYGHTACFFVNKLRAAGLVATSLDSYFESLFEVGVDEMSWDDMSKNEMQWPDVRAVTEYRRATFALVAEVIRCHPALSTGHAPISPHDPLWALFMAMEHERIHLETSSVLIREMPLSLLREPAAWPSLHPSSSEGRTPRVSTPGSLVHISAASIRLGKPDATPHYGWDNEYGTRDSVVEAFDVAPCMVTNSEFLQFVKAGAYLQRQYWSEEGWRWRVFADATCPTFWVAAGAPDCHNYRLRTIFREIALPPTWPVCVNFHEAKAYLAWKSTIDKRDYRLPTEAEHALLRRAEPSDPVTQHCSSGFANERIANLNLAFGSESCVWSAAANSIGVRDGAGNVWDWCEDDFHPLDGFKVHAYYDDFSTPCFDGEHAMILGGSFISTGNEASKWARFHFRRHFFQHAGFRVVAPLSNQSSAIHLRDRRDMSNKYETRTTLDQYLLAHFGSANDTVPSAMTELELGAFPHRCAATVIEWAQRLGVGQGNVLDVGSAVGAASFAMARWFDNVHAVDISAAFIDTAQALKEGVEQPYQLVIEGAIREQRIARVPDDIDTAKVTFRRADACSLPAEFADFDAVLAANLLCRLPSPKAFLERLGGARGLVKPGGIVVLASPYSWMEAFTTGSAWVGGSEQGGVVLRSHDALAALLGDEFELLHRADMPLMLREHARKFEYVVSDLTVWRRKVQ